MRRVGESGPKVRLRGPDPRPHFVVCGHDALVFHVLNGLLEAEIDGSPLRITLLMLPGRQADAAQLRRLQGVRVIRADRLDEATFRAAGLVGAKGLALLDQDDVGNIHAALCAQEVEPSLRVVMRMFNTNLATGVRRLFPDLAMLSDASMAAPAFVAAALGEVAPTHFRRDGRTLHVARRSDVRPEDVVCGLADTRDEHRLRLLPDADADLVLAEATGQAPGTEIAARRLVQARRRNRLRHWRKWPVTHALRSFATRKIGMATIAVLALIAILGYVTSQAEHVSIWEAIYLTLVTTLSGADPDVEKEASGQIMQVVLSLAGLALVPLITAAVVEGVVNARLALTAGREQGERRGHVVVVGLGNVGTRVMAQLNDFGIEVVAIDKAPEPRGAVLARRLGITLIVGDAALEETLRAASVHSCAALVVLSTDDVANLQAALNGRAIQPDLRVVLRLFDGDFAERIQTAFGIDISRSVSYLAAPSFTAALLHRSVIATIPVGRHALVVAEVRVQEGSSLDGTTLADAGKSGSVRVIAHSRPGQVRPDWSPGAGDPLAAGDQLMVVARQSGLTWLLHQASTAAAPAGETATLPAPRDGQR